jgi:hypothetical protein
MISRDEGIAKEASWEKKKDNKKRRVKWCRCGKFMWSER